MATKKIDEILNDKPAAAQVADLAKDAGHEAEQLLGSLAEKVSEVRGTVAAMAAQGASETSKALAVAVKKSKKGIAQLEKKWQSMDTKQKVVVVGGLLAVLAAAAAPVIVRKVRAKKK